MVLVLKSISIIYGIYDAEYQTVFLLEKIKCSHTNANYLTLTQEIFLRRRTLSDEPESSGDSLLHRARNTRSL